MAELSFWPSVLLELFKATFTAALVAGAAASAVWKLQDHVESLRKEREQALQREQNEHSIKTFYVRGAADLAGSFYFRTQSYARKKDDPETWGEANDAEFDKEYLVWATKCEGLEQELGARFGPGSEPRQTWHQIRDLLTVRYFNLRGKNTPELRHRNAQQGSTRHSGLSEAELEDPVSVLDTFHSALAALYTEILAARLVVARISTNAT